MKSRIVIHCMYSQSRGPMCCRWYCLAIESLLKHYKNKDDDDGNDDPFKQCIKQNADFEILKTISLDETLFNNLLNQQVYVLKNGFRGWVNKFKDNEKYVKDWDEQHWRLETIGGNLKLYHKNDW